MIENGAELDLKDNDGCTALVHAARESKPGCCKVLIEKGATVDAKDANLWTPFLWACYVGKLMLPCSWYTKIIFYSR